MHECRIVHFMIHDRISFGGSLIAIGLLYQWLTTSPLRANQDWAWWLLLVSGVVGFASFFAYLGYGYLDAWHGIATLALLPCFILGLVQSRGTLTRFDDIRSLLSPDVHWQWSSGPGIGRTCLLATAVGMIFGGLTICVVGMTSVFVPQDLTYMGVPVQELNHINERLVPLIAHDRAGFGGAVCCCGVVLFSAFGVGLLPQNCGLLFVWPEPSDLVPRLASIRQSGTPTPFTLPPPFSGRSCS